MELCRDALDSFGSGSHPRPHLSNLAILDFQKLPAFDVTRLSNLQQANRSWKQRSKIAGSM
jgi:hypothetical protein